MEQKDAAGHDRPSHGGPAFGHAAENGHCCGMTLRDYFAAAALQGMLAGGTTWRDDFRSIPDAYEDEAFAHYAYEHADAMLRRRVQKGTR